MANQAVTKDFNPSDRTESTMNGDERKRGAWLTGWLILMALLYIYEATSTLTLNISTLPDNQQTAAPFLIVAAVITGTGVMMLLFWRKVGFYILVATAIPLVILNLVIGVQLLLAFFPLYSLSTTWMLLQKKWQYFH